MAFAKAPKYQALINCENVHVLLFLEPINLNVEGRGLSE